MFRRRNGRTEARAAAWAKRFHTGACTPGIAGWVQEKVIERRAPHEEEPDRCLTRKSSSVEAGSGGVTAMRGAGGGLLCAGASDPPDSPGGGVGEVGCVGAAALSSLARGTPGSAASESVMALRLKNKQEP